MPISQPEQDVLLGVLAVRCGLVDRPTIRAALEDRAPDGPSLGQRLLDRGAMAEEDLTLLVGMVARQLQRHRGDTPRLLRVLSADEMLPEILARLEDHAPSMTLAGTDPDPFATRPPEADPDATRVPEADARPGNAASSAPASDAYRRFRRLRAHARGGLGEVFVAQDEELRREVALKEIQDHHADHPESRARFLLEAEVTGSLEHPGIVPVYGLGHYPDGRPYYAMRFIKGDSFKEAIARFHADDGPGRAPGSRPLEFRALLGRFLDACNAIEYAHSKGVLHRDLKPANVMLGPYGETLVVDWGLAKSVGRPDPHTEAVERQLLPSKASGSAETLPGSVLGTPQFMSPEQARGELDRLGPASDVYSLGATLYCLLTGRAPFEDRDLATVLEKVERGEFPAPRQVDRRVDPTLDAICRKAMSVLPEDRYPSARALTVDVEHWLADEPVAAWREPLGRRARRWARRHWPLVTATAAAVLVALAGLGAVLALQRGANRALAAKNGELDRANAGLREAVRQKDVANAALASANGRVQARFDLAREAIRSFKTGVEEDEALKEDRLRPLRDKLLGSARRFYDRLGELLEGQPDAGSKAVLAESYMELAVLIVMIGEKKEAREALRKAAAIRRELAARPDAGTSERVELAEALIVLGMQAGECGDHAWSLASLEEARGLVEPLATGPGETIEARRALGDAHYGVGLALQATGQVAGALASFRRALEVREALARDGASDPGNRAGLAASHAMIGDLLERAGDTAGATAEQGKAQVPMQAPDPRPSPGIDPGQNMLARRDSAYSHNRRGVLLQKAGDTAGATAELRLGRELMMALVAEHPAIADFRFDLAGNHHFVGTLLEENGDLAGALAEQRENQELMRALVALHPEVPEYRRVLSVSHDRIGVLLRKAGDTAGATAEMRRGQELLGALVADHPEDPNYLSELAASHNRLGDLLEKAGDLPGALAEHRKDRELFRTLVTGHPTVPDYRRELAIAQARVGAALTVAGRPSEALGELESARALFEELARDTPTDLGLRDGLAVTLNSSGDALRDLGRPGEARDRHARAVALAEGLASASPKVPGYRARLADGLRRLARLKLDAGDAGAEADARRSVALFEGLPTRDGLQWFRLACARATLAAVAGEPGLADRAIDDLHRAAAMGHRSPAAYRHEPSLALLSGREDFRRLQLDLAFPADPFAR